MGVRVVVLACLSLLVAAGGAPSAVAQESSSAAPTGPSGPAAAAPAPAAQAVDPEALVAEVILLPYNHSASYGPRRVVGPLVNVTQAAPDEWKGRIRDFDGVITVSDRRISAANLNLVVEWEGDGFTVQGLWDGKRVRIVFSAAAITARVDNRFYEMQRVAPDLFATLPQGPALRVKGDAAAKKPLYPQLILALLGVI
jgi:hypothetical protein